MRTIIPAKSPVTQARIALSSPMGCPLKPGPLQATLLCKIARLATSMLFATPLVCFASLAPQAAAPSQIPQSAHPAHKPNHKHARPSAAHPADPLPTPAPPAPPQPELPKWPVNEKPDPATVVWDSHGLRIEATNSSLDQILSDISADTGARVEGLDNDQRIFGVFGPGTAREVLGQLLEGSGYNFLLIGDQGQGTPREIVLSVGSAGNAVQGAKPPNPNDEDEADEQPQQLQEGMPPPQRAGFPPRSLQQRVQQQRMGQQQGQQPEEQPGNPPN